MISKKDIINTLNDLVEDKLQQIYNLIEDLRKSNTETKSSMGDKYETSREMLNQEINHLLGQQKIALEHQILIKSLKDENHQKIQKGSVVKTSLGNFIIVTSFGEFIFQDQKFTSISSQTPLAIAMLGKQNGDEFVLNNHHFQILEIY